MVVFCPLKSNSHESARPLRRVASLIALLGLMYFHHDMRLRAAEQTTTASPEVAQALLQLEMFFKVQSDPASGAKTAPEFEKGLMAVTRSLPDHVAKDKHVSLVVAVLKADRGINVTREVRAITNREPTFWLAWRCLVTTSLLFEEQKKAMANLLNYHKRILTTFVERDAKADNQDLAREIFWVRDACQQMGNLEDASERWVESILKHEEAERMLAQIANVEALQKQIAEDRQKKDEQNAALNKDPIQARKAIAGILGRVDASMTSLRNSFDTAKASLPAAERAYQNARGSLSSAISAQNRAEAALRADEKRDTRQLTATVGARAAVMQAERQVRQASRLYSTQLGIMQGSVVRMAAVSKAASEQLAAARQQYQEALAADQSAQTAAADAERRIAAHAASVPQLPTGWVDKGATSQEVAATLQISIEDIFADARGTVAG